MDQPIQYEPVMAGAVSAIRENELSNFEDLKSIAERLTGFARPMSVTPRQRKPHAILCHGDGQTPNNPRFSFILYRSPVDLSHAKDPAAIFEDLFSSNGWKPAWRNGIYPYNHFHTGTHEVLGIARGHARARIGGENGREIELRAGDVVVNPAGVGHRRLSASRNLLVVGAYPEDCRYDEPRPDEVNYDEATENIAKVGVPATDPVYGHDGPLKSLWQPSSSK
jgi:uncharacterized protein YjlB